MLPGPQRATRPPHSALLPWPGVWCLQDTGQRLKVIAAELAAQTTQQKAGTLLNDAHVACGDGSILRLITIQPENKKAMRARDALNGGILKTGEVLT